MKRLFAIAALLAFEFLLQGNVLSIGRTVILNAVVLTAIFCTLQRGIRDGLLIGFLGAVLWELLVIAPPGLWVVSTLATIIALDFMVATYVTSRSLLALMLLAGAGTVLWYGVFWLGTSAYHFFTPDTVLPLSLGFLRVVVIQALVHSLLVGAGASLTRRISANFSFVSS